MANETKHLFDDPKNVKRLLVGFYIICGLLLVLDLVIHRHVIHRWESLWVFYPAYGFVGCVVLVLVARWMRTFLMRPEDYYEKEKKKDQNKGLEKKLAGGLVDNKKGDDHVDD